MKAASPVDRDVALLTVEARCALHRATSTDTAKFKKTIEHRTVVADVVLGLLARVAVHVVGRDPPEKVNVLVGVELGHLVDDGGLRAL